MMFQLKDAKKILQTFLLFRRKKFVSGKVLLLTNFKGKNWVKKSLLDNNCADSECISSVSFSHLPLTELKKSLEKLVKMA